MVVQLAVPAEGLAGFYGLVMQKDEKNDPTKRFDTRELFGDQKIILIEHEGTTYRLMITRQGKLILNK